MAAYRPLIAVTTQTLHSIDGIPAGLPSSVVMNQRYYVALSLVGAVPVLVPLFDDDDATLREIFERVDGVLIPGGVDMDPASYGATPHPKLGRIDAARDHTELLFAKWAVETKKPFLGLCRGAQVLNVAMGGTLWQDLEAECPQCIKHDYFPGHGFERTHLAHKVSLAGGSRLRVAYESDSMLVNSMHHQGIRTLGAGLSGTAIAPDGLIEAVELQDEAFIVGVQWHPEVFELTDIHTRHLFEQFVSAAAQGKSR